MTLSPDNAGRGGAPWLTNKGLFLLTVRPGEPLGSRSLFLKSVAHSPRWVSRPGAATPRPQARGFPPLTSATRSRLP